MIEFYVGDTDVDVVEIHDNGVAVHISPHDEVDFIVFTAKELEDMLQKVYTYDAQDSCEVLQIMFRDLRVMEDGGEE